MKGTIAVLVFLLCAAAVLAAITDSDVSVGTSSASSQQATFINQDPDPAEPGGYVDIRFKLENVGTETARSVIFELLPKFPFYLDPGDSAVRKLGTLDARQIGENAYIVRYHVRVDRNAVQGNNEINIRYSLDDGLTYVIAGPFQVKVRSHNPILAIESVKASPEVVAPGDSVAVTLRLHNMAEGFFKNVKTSLVLTKVLQTATSVSTEELPFSPIGSTNEKIVLRIDSGETANLEFNLVATPTADAGIYKIPVVMSYSDELGKNYTVNNVFSLIVGEQPDVVVGIDSSTIVGAGSRGKVTIKFVNKGSMGLKFVSMQLKSTNDFDLLSSETVYIGNIDSDDYGSADFDIFLKKGAKDRTVIPVAVEFRDANNRKYSQSYNLELRTYTEKQQEQLGLKQGDGTTGILVTLAIVVVGLVAYFVWRRRKKK
jgi:hypothetical protein